MASDLIPKYLDRQTGQLIEERISHPKLQHWVATSKIVQSTLNFLLNRRWYASLYGKWVDRSASQQDIEKFITQFDVDISEIEKPHQKYANLNEFFSRKLKPGARPFLQETTSFCAPADGKILAYPQLEERTLLPIKNAHVDIATLLASEMEARPYHGGAACVMRLAPYDYHRFHFPVEGQASLTKAIDGRYYLVNPLALTLKPDLFAHNKRAVTYLETEHFGTVAYVEVSGFAVGRIVQTYQAGSIRRGQEKGYFQFGGSTLVLLFEPDKIIFDQDLVEHTTAQTEVQIKAGTQIGTQRI